MRDWRRDVLKAIGAPVTPHNLKFLANWQRWEGGHTNNSAKYNWLNTTQDAPGAVGEMNDVGVKIFKDRRSGIMATASTLMNGRYDDIVQALIRGNPYKHDVSRGLQVWVSGQPDGNPGYAQKVLGGGSAPKGSLPRARGGGAGAGGNPVLAQSPSAPRMTPLFKMAFGDDESFMALMQSLPAPAGLPTPKAGRKGMPTLTQLTPGGGWGGSKAIAAQLRDVTGLPVTSEKRDRQATASGGVSDHWTGSKTSYAYDLGGSVGQMDSAAKKLMASLGVNWDGKSPIVQNINRNGYRIQILYRTNTGGNHYDHIHIGVRKL